MAHHKLCEEQDLLFFFCFLLFQLNKRLLFLANAFYRMEGVITCWLNVFCLFFFVFVVFMRKYVICNNINLMKDYYVLFFPSLACVE